MGKRILLVEDDKYIALALKIRLQAEGFQVAVVNDKAAAFREAGQQLPDIALIDFNLPDGTGFEVMGEFSSNERTASVMNIIMTASKQPGLRIEAMTAGAIDYFEKPFKSAELIACIQMLAQRAATDESNSPQAAV